MKFWLIALFVILLTACGSGGADTPSAPPPPASKLTTLSISLQATSIVSGATTTASASGRDQFGQNISTGAVSWSSSPSTIAAIDASGIIAGVGAGQATITGSAGGIEASTTLSVLPGPATSMALTTPSTSAGFGVAFSPAPVVTLRDARGNVATNDNSTVVSLTSPVGAALFGTLSKSATAGVATFTAVGVRGPVGASYTLVFSAAGLSPVSQSISVSPVVWSNGTRIVGTDIPHGFYRSNSAISASCYWARLSGFSGALSDIIASGLAGGPSLVMIEASDRGFTSSSCAQWSPVSGPITSSQTAAFSDGMFIVGTDIASGTWRSSGTGTSCYWERLRGFSGELKDIITNDFGTSPAVVTISSGDRGFSSSRCGSWTKIN